MNKVTNAIVMTAIVSLVVTSAFAFLNAPTISNPAESDIRMKLASANPVESYMQANATPTQSAFEWRGHITMIVHDEFGKIKDYRELDNNVVDIGHDCVMSLVFNDNNVACDNVQPKFDQLAISDCDGIANDTNNDLVATTCKTTSLNTLTAMDNAAAESPQGDACGVATTIAEQATNVIRLARTFSAVAGETPIRESAIFNLCAAGAEMFAIRTITPEIPLVGSDTLTVNWDITLSDSDGA